jgi:poly(3-hydroxybutyrate) depolymerase
MSGNRARLAVPAHDGAAGPRTRSKGFPMHVRHLALVVLATATTLAAQAPRVNPERAPETPTEVIAAMAAREPYRPDVQIMTSMVRALLPAAAVSPEITSAAERLSADAAPLIRAGNTGDARRKLAEALATLLGRPWTPREDYAASLVLRTDMTVADTAAPFIAQLAQRYPARLDGARGLTLRASLAAGGLPGRADGVVPTGRIIREMVTYDLGTRDLNDSPFRFDLLLREVAEGSYMVVADVLDADGPVTRLVTPVYLVKNLRARQAAVEQRLAKITGHDSAAASVRYPFDLARGLNTMSREVNQFDFGVEVRRSEELLAQLEAGRDPLFRATGDTRRHYPFADAGEIMPYRIYVPTTWAPGRKMPLVLALHGSQLDESNFITRADGRMKTLAEQHGWIVAAPLGYRINGGYGYAGGAMAMFRPGRTAEFSEKDAMNVLELVATEYGADRSRLYVMGNSMGGSGTWHLGSKYADVFAAMAPCGSGTNSETFAWDRLKDMPVLIVAGELDPGPLAGLRNSVKAMRDRGMSPEAVEVPGGTHSGAVEAMMPTIFEFFARHQRLPRQ